MNPSQLAGIKIGAIIAYRLPLSQQPRRPDRLWHGVVEAMGQSSGVYWVRLIETGYEAFNEYVCYDQIVQVRDEETVR